MLNRALTPVLVASAFFAFGCDEPIPTDVSTMPSDLRLAVTYNEKDVPFEFCNESCGDRICIEGTDHWVIKRTETPSGKIHYSWRTNYSGTAVGTPSGNTWKMTGTWGNQVNVDDNDGFPFEGKYQDMGVLVGHGQVPNVKWKANFHVTINASGDVVVDRRSFEEKCQG